MANKITTLLDLDSRGFESSFKSVRKSVADADGVMAKFKAAGTGALGAVKANAGLLAVGGGAALLAFGDNILKAGAQMEAMEAKSKTVFGSQIGVIEQWADKSAGAMGLTEKEALAAGASIADLLIPMGFARDEATQMTTSLLDVSGALSAWSGGQRSAAEVSAIFTKAMLGEREELKSLGISISEADVQARLAEKGQKALTGAALAQAKAVATQELIYEKSTDAQKAWADGSMDAVKDQNKARSSLAELSEVMNESLYPVLVSLVPVVADLAARLEPLLGLVADVAGGQIGFATSFEKSTAAVGNMRDEIEAAGLSFDDWRRDVAMGRKSMDDLTVAIEDGTTKAMYEAIDVTDRAANTTDDYRSAVDVAAESTTVFGGPMANVRDLLERYTTRAGEAADATDDLTTSYKDLTEELQDDNAWLDVLDSLDAYFVKMHDAEASDRDKQRATNDLKLELLEYLGELENVPASTTTSIEAMIDQGRFDEAARALEWLSRPRSVAISAATGGQLPNVPKFDDGGVMPGPRGKHSLALVAGGETVLPTHKAGVSAGGNTYIINGIDVSSATRWRQQVRANLGRRAGVR